MQYAAACQQQHRPDEARAACEKILRTEPDAVPALDLLSGIVLKRGDVPMARDLCKRILTLEPGHLGALFRLASIAEMEMDFRTALDIFVQASAANPQDTARLRPEIDALRAYFALLEDAAAHPDAETFVLDRDRFSPPATVAFTGEVLRWLHIYKYNSVPALNALHRHHPAFPPDFLFFAWYFARYLYKDYLSICDYLPERATQILDIGCGFGGASHLLACHYHAHAPRLHLVELEAAREIEHPLAEFPNQALPEALPVLEMARSFMEANGHDAVTYIAAERPKALENHTYDLIVSFRSWGYIYRLATYLETACRVLSPGGTIITDVHTHTEDYALVKQRFQTVRVLKSYQAHRRLLLQHPT